MKNSMEPFLIKMLYTKWNLCFSKTGGKKKENKKLCWPRLLLGAMWARSVRKGELLGTRFQNLSCLTKKATPLRFWERLNEHSTTLALQRSRSSPSRWAHNHASSPEKHVRPSLAVGIYPHLRSLHPTSSIFYSRSTLLVLHNPSIDPSVPDFISKPTMIHVYIYSAN